MLFVTADSKGHPDENHHSNRYGDGQNEGKILKKKIKMPVLVFIAGHDRNL